MKKRQRVRKLILLLSFILYPVTYIFLSPDMLMFGASEGVLAGDIIFFAGLFVLSIFAGRFFCGWICPAGAVQDFASAINDKPASNRFNWIKFAAFIPWISFFLFLLFAVGGGVKQVDLSFKRVFGMQLTAAVEWIMYFGTVAIALAMALFAGKRGLCHYLCWVSPFMMLGMRIRSLLRLPGIMLRTLPERCNSCGICSKNCPMSLPVKEMVAKGAINHSECVLCASCVDSCPKKAIAFSIMRVKSQKGTQSETGNREAG